MSERELCLKIMSKSIDMVDDKITGYSGRLGQFQTAAGDRTRTTSVDCMGQSESET